MPEHLGKYSFIVMIKLKPGLRTFCSSLTSVTIPDSVTSIGNYAFYGCDSLTSVTIPDSVTSIGDSAFSGCSNLESVTIPDSVTSIGDSAFSGCSNLESVYITDLEAWYNIKFSSSSANPLYYANNLYLNGSLVKDLVIPDSVTSIGYNTFGSCSNLTSVVIPGSMAKIDSSAFFGCGNLTSVTFEDIKNWSVVISSGKKKKMNVKNVSKNATNLTQNYCSNEWIKE